MRCASTGARRSRSTRPGGASGDASGDQKERRAVTEQPDATGVGRDDLASAPQIRAIYYIAREMGYSEAEVEQRCLERYGRPPKALSKAQASHLITGLRRRLAETSPPSPPAQQAAAPAPSDPIQDQQDPDWLRLQEALRAGGFAPTVAVEDNEGPVVVEVWVRQADGAVVTVMRPRLA